MPISGTAVFKEEENFTKGLLTVMGITDHVILLCHCFFFFSTKFALIFKNLLSLFEQGPMSTVEPRYNKPLYNKVLRVQNDILDPSNSNIRCVWKRTLISQNFIIFNTFCQSLGPLLFSSFTVQLAHICDNERDRRRCTDSLSLYSDIDNIWVGDSGPRKLPLSLLTRVHIERVNFKENIWAFFMCRDEEIKSDEHVKAMQG